MQNEINPSMASRDLLWKQNADKRMNDADIRGDAVTLPPQLRIKNATGQVIIFRRVILTIVVFA